MNSKSGLIDVAMKGSYDIVIVGGGISGLYLARELLKDKPSLNIAIAEKYDTLGGRMATFHKGVYQWEEGAGRIPLSHTMVMDLIKEYGCTWVPIESASFFKPSNEESAYPNPFESLYIPRFLQPLESLDTKILATHTLEQLLEKVYNKKQAKDILDTFPYFSETKVMRADVALKTFLKGEMGNKNNFGIVKEGLSELIHRLQEDIVKRGCTILLNHALQDIEKVPNEPRKTDCLFVHRKTKKEQKIRAEKACILTLCRCHVAALSFMKDVPVLKHVLGKPLFRIYSVFPKKNCWFSDVPHIVTPERIRNFIPIDVSKGITMISYTDGDDTKYYHTILKEKGEKGVEKEVMKDIRALFKEKDIPEPLLTKTHYWGTGASYWLPGNYDPEAISKEALQPRKDFPGLYMCGESWSMRQAWIEGALEHTRECINLLRRDDV